MGIAAAVAGATAVAGVAGSALSAGAAGDAASQQADAANQASSNALAQYRQTRTDLQPFFSSGQSAVGALDRIFGLGGAQYAPAAAPAAPSAAAASPGGFPSAFATAPFSGADVLNAINTQGNLPQGFTFSATSDGQTQIIGPQGQIIASGATPDELARNVNTLNQSAVPTAGQQPGGAPAAAGPAGGPPVPSMQLQFQPSAADNAALANYQFAPTEAQLQATPGYQFNLHQGLQSTQNAAAARGLGVSGAALKGAANYATGLADNTLSTQANIFQNNYGNLLTKIGTQQGIFQQNLGNVLNPLFQLANLGEGAAAQTGNVGANLIGQSNNALIGAGNARAAGTVGSANALSAGLSSAGQAPLNYLLFNNLMGGGGGASGDPGVAGPLGSGLMSAGLF